MLGTVLRVSWLNLKRDRVAQGLTFVLPIAFFTIFGLVFGGMSGGDAMSKVKLAVVDEDQSEASRRLIAALKQDPSLRIVSLQTRPEDPPQTREAGLAAVRDGRLPVVLVLPKGSGAAIGDFLGTGGPAVELLADKSDPIASQVVVGLLQRAVMVGAPDLFMQRGLEMFEKFGGAFTPQQRTAVAGLMTLLGENAGASSAAATQPEDETDAEAPQVMRAAGGAREADTPSANEGGFTPVRVNVVDVLGEQKQSNKPLLAFYAAGTAVMFLLFSCSGAGGALLEEQESGTLERLLSSRLSMTGLLGGKWLFLTLMGVVQVTIMFIYGWAVFGIELFTPRHLAGFVVMTLATAGAAAAFGLVLATLCRSRAQLSGLATIVILMMSAVGGSMFPRFLMPEAMQTAGLATFNAWALDGYQKVFWYERQPWELWPQVMVLALLGSAFFIAARRFARRWEAV